MGNLFPKSIKSDEFNIFPILTIFDIILTLYHFETFVFNLYKKKMQQGQVV